MGSRSRLATLLALACALAPAAASAQYQPAKRRIELTGIAGYQLNSDISFTGSGGLSVGDAPVYGVSLGVETLPGAFAQLLWLYSDPTVSIHGVSFYQGAQSFDVPTHYFQVGGKKGVQRGRANIYGVGSLGAALFMPGDVRYGVNQTLHLSDTWRFGFTLGGGVKVDLTKKLALGGEIRLAAPVLFSSGGFYVGTGGSGLAVSGGIPLWQWNFLGGLTFTP